MKSSFGKLCNKFTCAKISTKTNTNHTNILFTPHRRYISLQPMANQRSRTSASCPRSSKTSWTSALMWTWRGDRARPSCSGTPSYASPSHSPHSPLSSSPPRRPLRLTEATPLLGAVSWNLARMRFSRKRSWKLWPNSGSARSCSFGPSRSVDLLGSARASSYWDIADVTLRV